MIDVLSRIKRLFRLRFAVLYPLAIYLVFFTAPSDDSLRWGVGLMVLGVFLRIWSNGYAIKLDKLTTSGPYAFIRNPLYLGTALIILGIVVMLQIAWLGLLVFAVLALVYARTIRNEQRMLTEKFGQAFVDYCRKVPAMWPTFLPYPLGEKWSFSWQRLWESREHKVLLWMAILVIGFYLKGEVFVEGEPTGIKVVMLMVLACLLGLIDLFSEYVRYCQKKMAKGGV